jgi:hypothetical protein
VEVIAWLLAQGAITALLVSLAVSPFGLIALSVLLERRPWHLRDQFAAFLYGDMALAGIVAAGAVMWPTVPDRMRSTAGWLEAALVLGGLVTGVLQARSELRRGVYTRAQVLSPTKIWHQVVIIPYLSAAVGLSLCAAVVQHASQPVLALASLSGLLFWAAMMVYDQSHPKVAHRDFDWSRLRTKTDASDGRPSSYPPIEPRRHTPHD